MREIGRTRMRSQLREVRRPPPFAVIPMLELTRRRGQANADHETYNLSLGIPNFPILSGF